MKKAEKPVDRSFDRLVSKLSEIEVLDHYEMMSVKGGDGNGGPIIIPPPPPIP
jgi:hypothetical protein